MQASEQPPAMNEAELVEAYHEVVIEVRQILALHRRMMFLMGAAKQDMHKLEGALQRAQDLEQEIAANAPPQGAA